MTPDELRAAAERYRYRPNGADKAILADAYLAEQETLRTVKLRCGYILGACQTLEEAKAEARAILDLLGEEPTQCS